MKPDTRNVILAMVLSALVIFGYQFFYLGPQQQRAQEQAAIAAQNAVVQPPAVELPAGTDQQAAEATATAAVSTNGANDSTYTDRAAALAATPDRVAIATDKLKGSINLIGGRIDDLQLTRYFETIENKDIITLLTPSGVLSPAGTPSGYYVEQSWLKQGADGKFVDATPHNTVWTVEGDNNTLAVGKPVTITSTDGAGLVFHRTFDVDANYLFTITERVDNTTGADVSLAASSEIVREGTPHVSNFFVQHEGPLGVLGSNNLVLRKYSDLQKDARITFDNTTGWLGFGDKYWATTIIAEPGQAISAQFLYANAGGKESYKAKYVEQSAVVAAGSSYSETSYVFAGAKEESVIAAYESQYKIDRLEMMIDWGWFSFLTKPMFLLLRWLYGIFGNFGVAVLTLTVLVKLVFFPLANRSYASMAAMRRVQPEMKNIQERFKDDRAAQQQAMMELYKKEKINPLSGCWPILIQIPVFFALYTVIFISLEMRHAPFFGWIQDLAAQDPTNIFTLFGLIPWNPTAVPFIGGLLHLGIWPLVMGVTMWVQMRLNPPPPDPTQAMIFNWMPVIFTFMLGTFPAGLVIYWSWNNFLSILQQYFIMKRHGADVDLFGNILTSLGIRKAKPQT